ncbi:MaoC family dehydratase [Sinomicrobium soli]|uniref:MaoC family dehydratase n=1 Tax=Sinomicrobium sp. N-1-3-6 TaxID=2219864 RepID=UPI000DCC2580|nr:MaoC family dehydratase [Sinomicrobium sp. N-1-3-6]RAV30984.1 MaoC family dehydratase [Sinomicrobium sp. N-1-3-6]
MKSSNLGNFYKDFQIGETVKHSLTKTIFESDNNFFSLLTMNHHPVHLSLEHVKNHQHGKILVVGTLVFSLVVGMTVPDISGKAIANLEYESVKHVGPVFIGDTIRAETTVINKWETSKKDRGIVYVETRAFNQDDLEVLCFRRKVLIPKT